MWTHFLISLYLLKIQLVSAYYLRSAYYQGVQYYPQFYAPNNDASLICFIYFPGFVYYPQYHMQQGQYPMPAPFKGHSIYQSLTTYSNAANELWASKPNIEESKQRTDSQQPLSFIGVPVIIPKVTDGHQMNTKEYSSTQTPTTIKRVYSESINVDNTKGPRPFTESDTEQPQRQTTTEQLSTVPFVTLPIFITQIRTSQQPAHESEKVSPTTTTESTQRSESTTEDRWIRPITTTIQSAKEWQPTETSIIFKENRTEKEIISITTEFPQEITKEWIPSGTGFDSRLSVTTEEQNNVEGSGSGDDSMFIDDEDGLVHI